MTDREVMQMALEALTCTGKDDDPGHRCGHCDDYVDRNGLVRAALRAQLAQPDRQALQAAGTHPAPCARHCEAKAFEIEIRGLKSALRAALEQQSDPVFACPRCGHCCPQQQAEPVAWIVDGGKKNGKLLYTHEYAFELVAPKIMCKPLYTSPPQRKPLTEEEAHALIMQDYCIEEYYGSAMELIRSVEQAHGIKDGS